MGKIKYSSITFDLGYAEMGQDFRPQYEWEEVSPFINGKDILNTFRIDKQYRYGIDSSLFLAQEKYLLNGNILLGICSCKDLGHSDLLVNIHSFEEFVMWDIYVSWYPSKYETYYFDVNEYKNAIDEIKKIFKHGINEVNNWVWMFGDAKRELKQDIIENKFIYKSFKDDSKKKEMYYLIIHQ